MFRDYLIQADMRGDVDVSVFKMYKLFIQREKFIYQTLNLFKSLGGDDSSQIVQGLAWCPTSKNADLKLAEL